MQLSYSHFVVEYPRLARSGQGDEVLVENLKDILADFGELALNLLSVALDHENLSLITLGLLLDGEDNSSQSTVGTNVVLGWDR